MSSTIDNNHVLPVATDNLLTDEEIRLLKYHLISKCVYKPMACWPGDAYGTMQQQHISDEINSLLNTLTPGLGYDTVFEYNLYVNHKCDCKNVINRINRCTVEDVSTLVKLLKILDADYFLKSVDKKLHLYE